MDEDDILDELGEEIVIPPVKTSFNRIAKKKLWHEPVKLKPAVVIDKVLEQKRDERSETRCPKCGAIMQQHKGSPRDGRPFRLVCLFCKNKVRRATAAEKRANAKAE